MGSDQLVLSFDTSAEHCAAALLCNGQIICSKSVKMQNRQAECLGPMVESLLNEKKFSKNQVTRIGVGIGPGNFTGIRISVSFARGLSLALGCPAIGINTFDATYYGKSDPALVVIQSTGGKVYVQRYPDALETPWYGVEADVSFACDSRLEPPYAKYLTENIAHLAAEKRKDHLEPPAPFYIKPPNAVLSRKNIPKILT